MSADIENNIKTICGIMLEVKANFDAIRISSSRDHFKLTFWTLKEFMLK
jgi:hypothetical protein